ncbi:hypothetical protein FRC10_005879 [Ceratobasidium sp. 414]|nr:hypothetical protein FRC10_005879 [Ceratobasidium sp. 414]
MVKSNCCVRIRREQDKPERDGVCYRARHTVNVKDVKYFKSPGGANEAEEGVKYNGQNPSVATCTTFGCDTSELSELSEWRGKIQT